MSVQYTGGVQYAGGVQYTEGCSVHQGDIINTVGDIIRMPSHQKT